MPRLADRSQDLAYGALSPEALQPFIKNPDGLVPYLAKTLLPAGFDALILLAAISAAISTISAIVLVTTTSLTADILRYIKPTVSDSKVLLMTRAVCIVIIAAAAILAVNAPAQIVLLVSVSIGAIACCVFVPLIFGLYWERGTSMGFVASLLASFGSVVMWQFFGDPLIPFFCPSNLCRPYIANIDFRKSGFTSSENYSGDNDTRKEFWVIPYG